MAGDVKKSLQVHISILLYIEINLSYWQVSFSTCQKLGPSTVTFYLCDLTKTNKALHLAVKIGMPFLWCPVPTPCFLSMSAALFGGGIGARDDGALETGLKNWRELKRLDHWLIGVMRGVFMCQVDFLGLFRIPGIF